MTNKGGIDMLNKTSQYNYKNDYYTVYENSINSWMDFTNSIIDNGYDIFLVELKDSAGDVSMKADERRCSVNYFLEHYDELTKYFDTMKLYIGKGVPKTFITVNDHENSIVLFTNNPELDLNDMIKEKELK